MKIILKKKISNLGNKYDQVIVKPGYARNFLFPKGYAIFATNSAIKKINEFKNKNKKKIKNYIKNLKIKFYLKKGKNGKLFGSITTKSIAKYLSSKDIEVDKKSIFIDEKKIKKIGTFKCQIILNKKIQSVFYFNIYYK